MSGFWRKEVGDSLGMRSRKVDADLLESARNAGYATKVIFISTEDPNLNIGRILIRMSPGGQWVPLSIKNRMCRISAEWANKPREGKR